jgi:hypothetical protein
MFQQHPFLLSILEHTSRMDPSQSTPAITFPAFLSVIMLFQSSDADLEKLKCMQPSGNSFHF